jgi:nucleoside 2-deoxyribosyltransferase
MKLYLAHPFDLRYEVRFWELFIEKETGLELINPFYDQERFDVGDIDAGRVTRSSAELDFNGIVRNDLGLCDIADGAIAVVRPGTYSIGTVCEAWYTSTQIHKPVYFLGFDGHPWLRYMIQEGKGLGFKTWQEMLTYFKELLI